MYDDISNDESDHWNPMSENLIIPESQQDPIEHKSGDLDFDRVERDEDYEPTIPERYNKYTVTSDGSTSVPNAPTMDTFRDELTTAVSMYWS
jgi:hypothetical protein